MTHELNNVMPFFIYAGAVAAFIASLTGRVKYGMYFLILFIPLQNVIMKLFTFPFGKDINDLLVLAMFIGWLVSKLSSGQRLFTPSSFNIILFLYLIFTYFSFWQGTLFLGLPLNCDLTVIRLQNWKNYMMLPILFLITLNNITEKKTLKRAIIFVCLSMFLMDRSVLSEVRYAGSWTSRAKFHGTFEWLGANEVAAFYATYTLVLIGLFLHERALKWRLSLGTIISLNLYCLVFLFSRGAYFAILAGLFLIGLAKNRILLVVILVLALSWQFILPARVIERLTFTEHEGELDESASKRLDYWQESIEYFLQSPLIGVGYNVKSYVGSKRDTHNLYLRTLMEQGVTGVIFLIMIMILAIQKGLKLFRRSKDRILKGLGLGFAACGLAVMVGNFFGDRWTYLQLGAYYWIFLGLVERSNFITAQEISQTNKALKESKK